MACWRSASPQRRPLSTSLVTAVIAAAGSGERLGAGGPKAFVPLGGKPMVEWSIAAFRVCESVGSIVVACPPGHGHEFEEEDLCLVDGGATRAQSVSNALAQVETELVAIHDAARPLVTPKAIDDVVAIVTADPKAAGAIAAAPVTDTVKQAKPPFSISGMENDDLVIESTIDRSGLWAAQTPQVFRVEALRKALEAGPDRLPAATDEAMLVERAGGKVLIHPSSAENLKVTTPRDLKLAEILLAERSAQ